jgi:GT2 family glycosyltransferase
VSGAAAKRPDWSFVLIGNIDTPSVEPLRFMQNVHFLGEQPYSNLPAYLQQFDVCLIPFKLTKIIQSTNPVKFYEYLSASKPVVATLLPELLPYKEFFYPASNVQEMVANIEQAMNEDSLARKTERVEWARQQTWQARYELLSSAIMDIHGLVSIIIVSYNNPDRIKECLESILEKTHYPRYEVIVVDNGSTPDVIEYLSAIGKHNPRVRVILNNKNLGFARANNIGFQAMNNESQYVVLLNNDTVVTRGWLSTLVHWLHDPAVGLVGPVTGLNGSANEAAIETNYRDLGEMEVFANQYSAQHRGDCFDIPMLAMYCVAMRRKVFEEIGPLDEQFGVGMFEDDDYTLRILRKGYRVICVEDVFIHHVGRASFSRLNEKAYQRIFDENLRYFESKWNIKWKTQSPRQKNRRKDE